MARHRARPVPGTAGRRDGGAADELRAAIDASGLVAKHGSYTFQAALMQASRAL